MARMPVPSCSLRPMSLRRINRRIPIRVLRLLARCGLIPPHPLTLVGPHPLDRRAPVPVHQPQPHQVTLPVRLVVVLERGAVVQHRAVVEQGRLRFYA